MKKKKKLSNGVASDTESGLVCFFYPGARRQVGESLNSLPHLRAAPRTLSHARGFNVEVNGRVGGSRS